VRIAAFLLIEALIVAFFVYGYILFARRRRARQPDADDGGSGPG
jgi:hypothetical protein